MRSISREVEDRWHDCSHGRASHRLAVHDGDKCVKKMVVKDGSGCALRRCHLDTTRILKNVIPAKTVSPTPALEQNRSAHCT